jgi:hypothetical protein
MIHAHLHNSGHLKCKIWEFDAQIKAIYVSTIGSFSKSKVGKGEDNI